MKSNTVYLVMNNSDLTEGCGDEYVCAVCSNEITAQRIAKGKYVQGTDCPVLEKKMTLFNGEWYIPFKYVPITLPTSDDLAEEYRLAKLKMRHERREKTLAKAKALGLTEEDFNIIMDVE